MNTFLSNSQSKPRSAIYLLFAVSVLIMIYWIVNAGGSVTAQGLLPSLPSRSSQAEALSLRDLPVPVPLPTPPAEQVQSTPVPMLLADSDPGAAPVPQPVPTPPSIP